MEREKIFANHISDEDEGELVSRICAELSELPTHKKEGKKNSSKGEAIRLLASPSLELALSTWPLRQDSADGDPGRRSNGGGGSRGRTHPQGLP